MTLAKAINAAREALDDLVDLQKSALLLDKRANCITAPEDFSVKRLCEIHGYGAVMDSAARQWHLLDGNGGGHTTYHCYSVVKKATIMAKKSLAALQDKPMTEDEIISIIDRAFNDYDYRTPASDRIFRALKAADCLYVKED